MSMQKARLLRLKNRIPGESPVEVYAQREFAAPQTLVRDQPPAKLGAPSIAT
jgi:hypothetical protein